jgi:N-methylhydantoinase B
MQGIRRMPAAKLAGRGAHDAIAGLLPDGIEIRLDVEFRPQEAMIEIDLRDNADCLDCGLNLSEACALNNVIAGIFNCLDPDIPHNSGAFRRIRIHLRPGCVVGGPVFPHSCSMATTNIAGRLVNLVQSTCAELGDSYGLAEGGNSMGAGASVISGKDFRRNGQPYINQIFATQNGGPGGPKADGWVCFTSPQSPGPAYRDSIELDEIKHPIHVRSARVLAGTGGAGRFRGAPAQEIIYGPKRDPMIVMIANDCVVVPAKGVRGGHDGGLSSSHKVHRDGSEEMLANVAQLHLTPGEWVRGIDSSGGGYGDPLERDPARVRLDVLDGWETFERAVNVYGVVLIGQREDDSLAVDVVATERLRQDLLARRR